MNRRWRICNPLREAEKPLENEDPGRKLTGKLTGPDEFEDPDLERLLNAWPDLPDAIKAGILALVNASAPRD